MPRQLRQRNNTNNWIDTFFDDPFFRAFDRQDDRLLREFKPSTDVCENEQEIKVLVNLPGLKKEDVKIDVDEEHRSLTVSGKVEKEKEENETYHCVERSHGSFSRTVFLPANVDLEAIKANLEYGVLKVSVPKKIEQKKVRSISIE